MRLVVGLGNPGREYSRTRHNLGFMLLDRFLYLKKQDQEKWRWEAEALTSRVRLGPEELLLAKPQTYMNLSGRAVRLLLDKYALPPEQMIVAYDDLDLPLGRIRIRERGSSGGHLGLESIIDNIGTDRFVRLRMGIRGPDPISDPAEYVLSPFEERELEAAEAMIERAAQALETIVTSGAERAMSRFN